MRRLSIYFTVVAYILIILSGFLAAQFGLDYVKGTIITALALAGGIVLERSFELWKSEKR